MVAATSRVVRYAPAVPWSRAPDGPSVAVDLAGSAEHRSRRHRIATVRGPGRARELVPGLDGADSWRSRGFARYLTDLLRARGPRHGVPEGAAGRGGADVRRRPAPGSLRTLRDTPPDAPVSHWAAVQQVAASWQRRAVHELAVHRWDAETIGGDPAPVDQDIALDGIAEFFEVFVTTGIEAGMVPPAQATLVLEITDTGTRREEHLPDPGPVTTMRGTASDLMLALWRRRDPLAFHVDGPREMLERWPAI